MYKTPDKDFEELASNWPQLEIANHHTDTHIEIWASSYGGIGYFWAYRYDEEAWAEHTEADLSEFVAIDRLFESPGEALNDCLDFVQEKMVSEMETWIAANEGNPDEAN